MGWKLFTAMALLLGATAVASCDSGEPTGKCNAGRTKVNGVCECINDSNYNGVCDEEEFQKEDVFQDIKAKDVSPEQTQYDSQPELDILVNDSSEQKDKSSADIGEEVTEPLKEPKIFFVSNRTGHYNIHTMDPNGDNQINITGCNCNEQQPVVSASGEILYFAREVDGTLIIIRKNLNSGIEEALTGGGTDTYSPTLANDGSGRIWCGRYINGNSEIVQIAPTFKNLTEHPGEDWDPDYSPEINRIVFSSNRSGTADLYLMDPDGTGLLTPLISNANEYKPNYLPNGKGIVFETDYFGLSEIVIALFDPGFIINAIDNINNNPESNDNEPSVSMNGMDIIFKSDRDGNLEIYRMNIDGSNQINLTQHPSNDKEPFHFAPN